MKIRKMHTEENPPERKGLVRTFEDLRREAGPLEERLKRYGFDLYGDHEGFYDSQNAELKRKSDEHLKAPLLSIAKQEP